MVVVVGGGGGCDGGDGGGGGGGYKRQGSHFRRGRLHPHGQSFEILLL